MKDEQISAISGLPDRAPLLLRGRLGLEAGAPVRISYIPGPGDVVGTFFSWRLGTHDTRVPVVTYSAQFFELVRELEMDAQILCQCPALDVDCHPFIFRQVLRNPWSTRNEYFRSQDLYGKEILAALDDFDPHIVLTSTDFPSSFWARQAVGRRRLVLTAHNTFWARGREASGLKGRYKRLQLAFRARALSDAVCTSPECAAQISRVTLGRIQGLSQIPQMTKHYTVKKIGKVRRLLYLGRIEEEKGIFMLLDAFAALGEEFDDLCLAFAGSGSASVELKSRIARRADPRISFVEKLDGPAVHDAIDASDLLICPTKSTFNEGLAVVGFEAAAHGVPTLMSSVVPAVDVLRDACVEFEADNPAALEAALRDLIIDDEKVQKITQNLEAVRETMHDRSRSWGSQLAQVLLRLK